MDFESTTQEQKLRALPVQLIEVSGGIILKRGRVEFRIGGERAAEALYIVLTATAGDGATREQICELFAAPDRPAVEYLIQQLESRRILVAAHSERVPISNAESSLDVFYWHFDEQPQQVNERLNNQHIVIVGINYISRQLVTSLVASGMENVEVINFPLLGNLHLLNDAGELITNQWPVSLKLPIDYRDWINELDQQEIGCLIATSDSGTRQLMRSWNEFCVKQKCHFLPVVLQDLIGYVGPLVVPGETACYECLRARENSHMEDPLIMRAAEASLEGQAITGFHPSMASVLGDIAAIELSKFYGAWMAPQIVGTLIEVNLLAPHMTSRKVLKMPRCPVCSTLNRQSSISPYKDTFLQGNEVHS